MPGCSRSNPARVWHPEEDADRAPRPSRSAARRAGRAARGRPAGGAAGAAGAGRGRAVSASALIDAVWEDDAARRPFARAADARLAACAARCPRACSCRRRAATGWTSIPARSTRSRFERAGGESAARSAMRSRCGAGRRSPTSPATTASPAAAAARLEDLRLRAQADRIEAELARGDGDRLVAELDALRRRAPARRAPRRASCIAALAADGPPGGRARRLRARAARLDEELGAPLARAAGRPPRRPARRGRRPRRPRRARQPAAPRARASSAASARSPQIDRAARRAPARDARRAGRRGQDATRARGVAARPRVADGVARRARAVTARRRDRARGARRARPARGALLDRRMAAAATALERLLDVLGRARHAARARQLRAPDRRRRPSSPTGCSPAAPACAIWPPAASRWRSPARRLVAVAPLALPRAGATPPARSPTPPCSCSPTAPPPPARLRRRRRQRRRRRRDLPPARRPAARDRARRRPPALAARRADRRPPRRPLPPAHRRQPHRARRASARCARWSTGAGTCSTEAERRLAARLAVFPAGATLRARAVCAGGGRGRRRLDLLAALVDRSLAAGRPTAAAARYRMLETIREYGLERLAEAGELDAVRAAHARYFAELAERGRPAPARARAAGVARAASAPSARTCSRRCATSATAAMRAPRCALAVSLLLVLAALRQPGGGRRRGCELALPRRGRGGPARPPDRRGDRRLSATGHSAADDPRSAIGRACSTASDDRRRSTAARSVAVVAPVLALLADEEERAERLFGDGARAPGSVGARDACRWPAAQIAENDGDVDGMRCAPRRPRSARFREVGDRWGPAIALRPRAGLLHARRRARRGRARARGGRATRSPSSSAGDERCGMLDCGWPRCACAAATSTARSSAASARDGDAMAASSGDLVARGRLARGSAARGRPAPRERAGRRRSRGLGRDRPPAAATAARHARTRWPRLARRRRRPRGRAHEHLVAGYAAAIERRRTCRSSPLVGVRAGRARAGAAGRGDAAELLGAAARLRGAEDATTPDVARLGARAARGAGRGRFRRGLRARPRRCSARRRRSPGWTRRQRVRRGGGRPVARAGRTRPAGRPSTRTSTAGATGPGRRSAARAPSRPAG